MGFYGYGNDYYASYYQENLLLGNWNDRLGWIISTLTIGGVHVGVYIVSFILSLAVGLLIREHILPTSKKTLLFFIILYIIAIHTWPVIMSTSNVMRQGLAMSFIFFSLIFYLKKSFFWLTIISILALFLHKSSLIFSLIILGSYILDVLTKHIPERIFILTHFFVGIISFWVSLLALPYIWTIKEETRVIGGDFRLPFVLIALVFITVASLNKSFLCKGYNLFVYYFSFIFPVFLLKGLNWEFERLGMMMLFPYVFSFGSMFNRISEKIYLLASFSMLLILTFHTGMYASLR
jgi:hypothetical protein